MPRIPLALCVLRDWQRGDEDDIVRYANNPRVAEHLRERFPQPYTLADAAAWIAHTETQPAGFDFAITIDDRAVGGIGFAPGNDIHRVSAEVGYWLGEAYWGRGIASCALAGLTRFAFERHSNLNRMFAYVDSNHTPSIRVLEKAGYRREGHLRGCAIKHGQLRDQFVYARTRSEVQGQ